MHMVADTKKHSKKRMIERKVKTLSVRHATAVCELEMMPRRLVTIKAGKIPKGDLWPTVQLAGILATRHTGDLVPLHKNIRLNGVGFRHKFNENGMTIEVDVIR